VRIIRMKIDIGGTRGHEAWNGIRQFDDATSVRFGPEEGNSGKCQHSPGDPHYTGEWWGAVVVIDDNFLAEYALPHYLEQPRVMDAYIEPE
jgi:hypothetical protein